MERRKSSRFCIPISKEISLYFQTSITTCKYMGWVKHNPKSTACGSKTEEDIYRCQG
jgi:hypothetical protein